MKEFFASRWGMVFVGAVIGVVAVALQALGNPPNMGICVACMERDIAGALKLHQFAKAQYLRPEIIGFILGGTLSAVLFKEFRARAGSAPAVRFMLGFFAMTGALVFLGCPWRVLLRMAGGDANGLIGFAGLASGAALGARFLNAGFTLGRSYPGRRATGAMMPLIALILLSLVVFRPSALASSVEGPGSQHAAAWLSLVAALAIGFLAQRSRFCTVGAIRDVILIRNAHLFYGVLALLAAAFAANLVLGQFHPGFVIAAGKAQPIAHTSHVWNFLGMALSGLAFVLAGGCPGRQLVLSGEGDGDASVFVVGMMAGAALAHNFDIASSPAGPGANAPVAVFAGLAFCLVVGILMREKE